MGIIATPRRFYPKIGLFLVAGVLRKTPLCGRKWKLTVARLKLVEFGLNQEILFLET